jgi:hypothetical protein
MNLEQQFTSLKGLTLDFFTPMRKLYAFIILCVLAVSLHYIDKHYAIAAVNAEWEQKLTSATQEQKRANKELIAGNKQALEDKNANIKNIQSELNAAIRRLRERGSRPEQLVITEVRETCTGRQLFREDAEFLTREASSSDQVVVDRDFYYNEYEKARVALERLKHDD